MPDSIANDTIGPLPWARPFSTADDAPTGVDVVGGVTHGPVAYTQGFAPEARAVIPGTDSGIMALVLAIFLLVALSMSRCRGLLRNFVRDLWDIRRRQNAEASGHTIVETRATVALLLLTAFCEAAVVVVRLGASDMAVSIGREFALMIAYMIFQLAACNVVGYAFTTDAGRRQWNKGFIASQALLGIVLTPVAAAALFFPEDSTMVFVVAAAAYIAARVTFIAKGFRLFYDNFLSLLYFILYFCTLEIAPVAALYLISINIIA